MLKFSKLHLKEQRRLHVDYLARQARSSFRDLLRKQSQ
jgi:hypothetical protein